MCRRAVLSLLAVAMALAVVARLLEPVPLLTVRVLRPAGKAMRACPVRIGSEVRLAYRHSVERTAVEGRFSVGPGRLLLAVETRFVSTGTGLPNTAVSRTRRDGRWLVVDEEGRPLSELRFYVQAVNETRLSVDGRIVDLDGFPSGNLLRIGVEVVPRWRWWLWRATGLSWSRWKSPDNRPPPK